MKSATFASQLMPLGGNRLGKKGAELVYHAASRPSYFRRVLWRVRLCAGYQSFSFGQVIGGVGSDADVSFEDTLGAVGLSAAFGDVQEEVKEGVLPARVVIRLCRKQIKMAGLSIPTKGKELQWFIKQENVAAIVLAVLPRRTWREVLVMLQKVVMYRYARWIGKCADVKVIPGISSEGESSLREIFEVVGAWDPNRPDASEERQVVAAIYRGAANAISTELLDSGRAKDLIFTVGVPYLSDYLLDFLVEFFTTRHLTGPEVIDKYFYFLSAAGRSRLLGFPRCSGQEGWEKLGLIWRSLIRKVLDNPLYREFFGPDLDAFVCYFGLTPAVQG